MDLRYRHSVTVAAVVTDELAGAGDEAGRQRGVAAARRGAQPGRNPRARAGPEVREETGVDVRPGRLTGVYNILKLGVVALVFRADVVGGEASPTPRSQDVAWWTREQVAELMMPAFALRILDALLESNVPASGITTARS